MDTKSLFDQRLAVERDLTDAITCLYLSPTNGFKQTYVSLVNSLAFQLRMLDNQIQSLPVTETITLKVQS